MHLDDLPPRRVARISRIDWDMLPAAEGRRLRELGFDEGVTVEVRHRGGIFRRGPITCQVGRMLVALRRNHAMAIEVVP